MKSQLQIILASTSPQRISILQNAGFNFKVTSPNYDEVDTPNLSPTEQALDHAIKKAESVAKAFPESLIIGCDTVVDLNGKLIGKPSSATHATELIKSQQGQKLKVISGIAVLNTKTNQILSDTVTTEIEFAKLSDQEVEDYIKTNEWKDKSGAFSIQNYGSKFITSIQGDYFNVVGLPIARLYEMIKGLYSQS